MLPELEPDPAERTRVAKPVRFESLRARGAGWLTNVSERAAFVRTRRAPAVGEAVHVRLGGDSEPLLLDGQVRWRGRRSDSVAGFKLDLVQPPERYLHLVRELERTALHGFGVQPVAERIAAVIPVAIEAFGRCDSGIIRDLSSTGAQLSDTRVDAQLGERLLLNLVVKGSLSGLELAATVVRRTGEGSYAVQFDLNDEAARAELAALIGAQRERR